MTNPDLIRKAVIVHFACDPKNLVCDPKLEDNSVIAKDFMQYFLLGSATDGFEKSMKTTRYRIKNGNVAIKVTNIVKGIIENPAIEWAVALTPTKKDDEILAKAKEIVPRLAVKIGLAMGIIKEVEASANIEVAFSRVLNYVSESLPEEGKAIFYRELSGAIAEALSDGNMSTAEAVGIVQLIFKKIL